MTRLARAGRARLTAWSPGSAFALWTPPDTTHLWAYAESMGGPEKTDDELLCQGHSAGGDFPALEADLVYEALAAIERRHWERLKLLLHPYLHWTTKDGETLRGRKRVIARLVEAASPSPPSSCEFRDRQIYRWREGSA
jgi:hypothetical protein